MFSALQSWCWRCSVQWDHHKKGFSAQILFSFEFGGTQPWPSGAFGKEFANGYWEIMWEIQPTGHKLEGRRAARNMGINKWQKIFSKTLRDFRILGAVCVHFCPNKISPRGHKQLQKKQTKKRIFQFVSSSKPNFTPNTH